MTAALFSKRAVPRIDLAIILLVALVATVLRYQGWSSAILNNFDLLPYHVGAFRFFQTGQMEERGDKSSYYSFSPPGTFYLMLPGTLLFKDARLTELPAVLLPNLATLVFLYLITQATLGRRIALGAVIAVGLSQLGYLGAWPVGHPAYVLGALYFLLLWVRDRKAWALAVALVITAFGLYVDLAIAPFVLVFPVLWLLYRPPIRIRGVLLAILLSLLIWFPYLRYETTRGFVDIRSLLLRENLAPNQGTSAEPICFASVLGRSDTWEGTYRDLGLDDQGTKLVVDPGTGRRAQLEYHLCSVFVNLDRNFDSLFFLLGYNQLANSILWTLSVMGLVILFCAALGSSAWVSPILAPFWKIRLWVAVLVAAIGGVILWLLLGAGLWENCCTTHHHINSQVLGLLSQARSFFPAIWASLILGLTLSRRWRGADARSLGVLSLGIAIPWGLLVWLAEPNTALRFWWIWPAEVLMLIVGAEAIGSHLAAWKFAPMIPVVAAIVAIFPLPLDFPRIASWRSAGYAGEDSGQIATVDFLIDRARSERQTTLTVGYDILTYDFTEMNAVMKDPLLRRGAWFDFLLESRGGIQNLNQTVGGLSDQDQFRVVELLPGQNAPPEAPWLGFRKVAGFGLFIVYESQYATHAWAARGNPRERLCYPGTCLWLRDRSGNG